MASEKSFIGFVINQIDHTGILSPKKCLVNTAFMQMTNYSD